MDTQNASDQGSRVSWDMGATVMNPASAAVMNPMKWAIFWILLTSDLISMFPDWEWVTMLSIRVPFQWKMPSNVGDQTGPGSLDSVTRIIEETVKTRWVIYCPVW